MLPTPCNHSVLLFFFFSAYRKLSKGNRTLKPKVEKADNLMEQTLKAEDAFITAEADSVSIDDVLEGTEGTLSIVELRALEEKAEEAIKAPQSGLEEIINREETSLEMMNEMAFGNKDYNPLKGHMTRRMLESQYPQLIMERNKDCDTEACLRLW